MKSVNVKSINMKPINYTVAPVIDAHQHCFAENAIYLDSLEMNPVDVFIRFSNEIMWYDENMEKPDVDPRLFPR